MAHLRVARTLHGLFLSLCLQHMSMNMSINAQPWPMTHVRAHVDTHVYKHSAHAHVNTVACVHERAYKHLVFAHDTLPLPKHSRL